MNIKEKVRILAEKYRKDLNQKIANRELEMEQDDKSHHLIYKVLGIDFQEGEKIDLYQNTGRFLYRTAGSFLEEATILCFEQRFPRGLQRKVRIENTFGSRPKTFEIDCLVGNRAYEVKWRDATTDGDHITKEHTRVKTIESHGYLPIRIMFYYPNRAQAIRIQETLETLYAGLGGEYYYGEGAWAYVHETTGVDLKSILKEIALEKGM